MSEPSSDERAFIAEERLRLAQQALIDTGYFTTDEVGEDVAPRIVELWSAMEFPPAEAETLPLVVAVVAHTNMGDHGERLTTMHEYVPGERVETLVRRVMPALGNKWAKVNPTDQIVLRLVVGADGEVQR